VATSKKTKKQTARDRGVPDLYLSPAGTFRPGMDARYKSDLCLAVTGGTEAELSRVLVTFSKDDAKRRLRQRGWTPFLSKREAVVAVRTKTTRKARKS
jgi:hypothetical protein